MRDIEISQTSSVSPQREMRDIEISQTSSVSPQREMRDIEISQTSSVSPQREMRDIEISQKAQSHLKEKRRENRYLNRVQNFFDTFQNGYVGDGRRRFISTTGRRQSVVSCWVYKAPKILLTQHFKCVLIISYELYV